MNWLANILRWDNTGLVLYFVGMALVLALIFVSINGLANITFRFALSVLLADVAHRAYSFLK